MSIDTKNINLNRNCNKSKNKNENGKIKNNKKQPFYNLLKFNRSQTDLNFKLQDANLVESSQTDLIKFEEIIRISKKIKNASKEEPLAIQNHSDINYRTTSVNKSEYDIYNNFFDSNFERFSKTKKTDINKTRDTQNFKYDERNRFEYDSVSGFKAANRLYKMSVEKLKRQNERVRNEKRRRVKEEMRRCTFMPKINKGSMEYLKRIGVIRGQKNDLNKNTHCGKGFYKKKQSASMRINPNYKNKQENNRFLYGINSSNSNKEIQKKSNINRNCSMDNTKPFIESDFCNTILKHKKINKEVVMKLSKISTPNFENKVVSLTDRTIQKSVCKQIHKKIDKQEISNCKFEKRINNLKENKFQTFKVVKRKMSKNRTRGKENSLERKRKKRNLLGRKTRAGSNQLPDKIVNKTAKEILRTSHVRTSMIYLQIFYKDRSFNIIKYHNKRVLS